MYYGRFRLSLTAVYVSVHVGEVLGIGEGQRGKGT